MAHTSESVGVANFYPLSPHHVTMTVLVTITKPGTIYNDYKRTSTIEIFLSLFLCDVFS